MRPGRSARTTRTATAWCRWPAAAPAPTARPGRRAARGWSATRRATWPAPAPAGRGWWRWPRGATGPRRFARPTPWWRRWSRCRRRSTASLRLDDHGALHQGGVEGAQVVQGPGPAQHDQLARAVGQRPGVDRPAEDAAAGGRVGHGVLDLPGVQEAHAVADVHGQLRRTVEVLAEPDGVGVRRGADVCRRGRSAEGQHTEGNEG